MSQITIRVPDDVLAFIDGQSSNRTAYVLEALEHERRRRLAEADILAMANAGADAHAEAEAITTGTRQAFPDID
ncbi:hypothetical protein [Nocardia sp. BMG51109]|uniref:hypothetical protein n=1 Tax=Nocardia sp. BMG51109 TaxID=1056816 RepID=UPI000467BF40|nr:hypothetical protein [Nocardia sp. BMG51109]